MRTGFFLALTLASWNVCAQDAPARLTFEVALVKRSAPDVAGVFVQPQPSGDLRIKGATLKNLIALAYNVREFAISDATGWASSDRFNINARVGSSSGTPQQLRERLKSLLAERFQLAIHTESKEQNVYELVVAKNGPKLSEAKPDSRPMIRKRGGVIVGEGVGMQMLVVNIANSLDRPVLDKTGLSGRYDFNLVWSLEADTPLASASATPPGAAAAVDPPGPSVPVQLEMEKAFHH